MKQKTAGSKIYAICIALALLVLLAVNVTYAYFSANKIIQSDGAKMGNVSIRWSNGSSWYSSSTASTVNISAVTEGGAAITDLSRGTTFYMKESGTILKNLGLYSSNSTVYARFWVDAYITNSTTNYGQYFKLNLKNQDLVTIVSKTGTENGVEQTNNIYFVTYSFSGNVSLIGSMKIVEDAPMDLLSQEISISISVEAVQANKDAVQALWGDWKGYLDSWIN